MKMKLVAKVLVLNSAGQVLLLRRSKTDRNRPGDWDYPGGGVEAGEDFAEAATRELHEEAGIDVHASDLQLVYTGTGVWDADKDEIIYTRFLYKLQLADGQDIKLSPEHDKYEWMDVEHALKEFTHTFYNAGLRFAAEHNLL